MHVDSPTLYRMVGDAVRLTIDFLEDGDDARIYLSQALRYGLEVALEAELIPPEFASDLHGWMKAETARQRPLYQVTPQREYLRESKWYGFWSTLEAEQEVRWTQTKLATYFCVTGELVTEHPDSRYRGTSGPFVELRRHTGKTFWSHIAQVRPAGWIKKEDSHA